MHCPFVTQFLERLHVDLDRSSINVDLIEKATALEHLDVDPAFTDARVAWACVAGLNAFTQTPSVFPPAARHWPLTDAFLTQATEVLAPYKKHLTVRVTEVQMLDARAADLVQKRKDERELSMLRSLEAMFASARTRSYGVAGDAFYDFIYRLCQDTERLPAWAERLTEIR